MKTTILIIIGIFVICFTFYWIREIIRRSLNKAYDFGYKEGVRAANLISSKFQNPFENK